VSRNQKKRSVKKKDDSIEVSMGDKGATKYDIMTSIAQKYTIYEATVWLNTPLEKQQNKTPAQLMIEGQFSIVKEMIDNEGDIHS